MTNISVQALTINEAVGREVQLWLKRGNLTQAEVAKLLHLTQGTVSSKLRGRYPFTLQELLTLAGVLNVSLADLLGGGILNTKIPTTTENSNDGEREIAPIGFIPNGASYEVALLGLEPRTQGF